VVGLGDDVPQGGRDVEQVDRQPLPPERRGQGGLNPGEELVKDVVGGRRAIRPKQPLAEGLDRLPEPPGQVQHMGQPDVKVGRAGEI
jgi:hypothetical protein